MDRVVNATEAISGLSKLAIRTGLTDMHGGL